MAQNHMDLDHIIFLQSMDNQLFLAPLSDQQIQNVLDIGTGTGIWAIDFADQLPHAQVTGTDLSPIQPTLVPPNCHFQVDDAESDWTFRPDSFDLIHIRVLMGSISSWPRLYAQCLRALRPGGYIEQQEYSSRLYSEDGSLQDGSILAQGSGLAPLVFNHFGTDLGICEKMKDFMEQAGFQDIVEKTYKWPIGAWPKDTKLKELGVLVKVHAETALENWSIRPLSRLGWTREQIDAVLEVPKRELRDPSIHAIQDMRVCYGRKPMD